MSETLPPTVTVRAGNAPLRGTPALPGSKYATVRTVLAAALGDGPAIVSGVAHSDDTAALLRGLRACGVTIDDSIPETLRIVGCGGRFPAAAHGDLVTIDAGNAGAVLRLLLGVAATLPHVRFTTDYTASLGTRPNAELLAALEVLGVVVTEAGTDGRLPIALRGGTLHGGDVSIPGARSSQYLSALLFLAPLIDADITITVQGMLTSAGFVRLTLSTLAQAGIAIAHSPDLHHFMIAGGQYYQARDWQLPRDFPTAALWLALGAVASNAITLHGLDAAAEDGMAILAALGMMGANITRSTGDETGQITLTTQGGTLHGAELDGEPIIDSVPALAAAACFATGTTIFRNVATLRLKESNRIDALCAELNAAGAEAIPGADTITIIGHPGGIPGGTTVDAHDDHRLAMALALVALRTTHGLTITGAQHVAKSYPRFWDELARLGAIVTAIPSH